jgi:hypothetical protein
MLATLLFIYTNTYFVLKALSIATLISYVVRVSSNTFFIHITTHNYVAIGLSTCSDWRLFSSAKGKKNKASTYVKVNTPTLALIYSKPMIMRHQ